VVVERESQRAQVVLVGNSESPERLLALAAALQSELGEVLHSLWWNGNPDRTNVILGSRWVRLAGEPFVRESIGGARIYFPPGAFGQSHLELADRLVERVHGFVPHGAVVAEYHAGCGAIGLGLAARCRALRINERSPDAILGLERGIEDLAAADRARVRICRGEASAAAEIAAGADVVIVDPPRKGIDEGLLRALCDAGPARIVYVSCDPTSLARDVRLLEDGAGLALRALEAFALFPYTEHAEAVALLERPL
jgi:23S rRNA (uracil1939-C5)-methyltransferase